MYASNALPWLLLAACTSTFTGDDGGPLAIGAIEPALGSVAGGSRVTITGAGFTNTTKIAIGGIECGAVKTDSSSRLTCLTGSSDYIEGVMNVVADRAGEQATLPGAFTYQCPWTTSTGRRSCGAAPATPAIEQAVATWITQFQPDHGFVPRPDSGTANMADGSDFALGSQSVSIVTNGYGTPQDLVRLGGQAFDFTDKDLKIWVKVENVAHLNELYVMLGDAGLQNYYRFKFAAHQSQQWMTDGDWVAIAVPWSAQSYTVVGAPNRAALTDIAIRAADDALGIPVRVHLNGIALVDEPVERFPQGVISFTFDDNFSSFVDPGAAILAQHGFAATAYVIVDMVDTAEHATLADLHRLADAGWDISAHAATDAVHSASYGALTSDAVENDMVDARAWLMKNRFAGHDQCAYPKGVFSGSTDVLGLAGRYFTSCRTIFQGEHETVPASDARKLRVMYVTSAVPLAAVEAAIDDAHGSRDWLVLVFHRFTDVPVYLTQWPASDFAALVDYVAASAIPVRTVSEVLAP